MREITGEELEKVLQSSDGKPFVEIYDQILPGFKRFCETDPAFSELIGGKTELVALMFVFAQGNRIPIEALTKLQSLWQFAATVGYYMREQEGERVPTGATVH